MDGAREREHFRKRENEQHRCIFILQKCLGNDQLVLEFALTHATKYEISVIKEIHPEFINLQSLPEIRPHPIHRLDFQISNGWSCVFVVTSEIASDLEQTNKKPICDCRLLLGVAPSIPEKSCAYPTKNRLQWMGLFVYPAR